MKWLLLAALFCVLLASRYWSLGGWNMVWALVLYLLTIFLVFIALLVHGFQWTTLGKIDERGRPVVATQIIIGKGAEKEMPLKLPDTYFVIQPPEVKQINSPNSGDPR